MKQQLLRLAAGVFAVVAPASLLAQQPAGNPVENAHLEAPLEKTGLPLGWTVTQKGDPNAFKATVGSPGRFSGKALYVEGVEGLTGEYCVVVTNRIPIVPGKTYTARCWTQLTGETSRATLKFDYFDADKKYLGSGFAVSAKTGKPEWQLVSTTGSSAKFPGAKFIAAACSIHQKGRVGFDDLEVGVFDGPDAELNLLEDGGMECLSDQKPLKWNFGCEKSGTGELLRRVVPVKQGFYSLQLKGAAQWLNAGTTRVPLDKAKTYTFTGFIRARAGNGKLQINYFKDNMYLGNHQSTMVTANEWTEVTMTADPSKYPDCTHIAAIGAAGGKESDVFFDDFKLTAK